MRQEEDLRRAKEEQERKEEEEYQKLKASFVVEEQGEAEELTEQEVTTRIFLFCSIDFDFAQKVMLYFSALYFLQSRNLLQEFIQYVKVQNCFLVHFNISFVTSFFFYNFFFI